MFNKIKQKKREKKIKYKRPTNFQIPKMKPGK